MAAPATPNPYLSSAEDGSITITPAGHDYLSSIVTNIEENVYSFTGTANPVITAAAMARLSRFGGDMRELILKEFAGQEGQEAALLRRVLTQFGDDSVQQLGYVPLVVENASNLLTKQLEWGRLAAYLEQSTRYIYYDVKKNGRYRYYTPVGLPQDLAKSYRQTMDDIFELYSEVVHKMTEYYDATDSTPQAQRDVPWRIAMRGKACDAARGLLPVATTSTVGIVGSAQAIDNLIMHLLSQDLAEAQQVGASMLREVRKHHGIFFERTDREGRGLATIAHRRQTRQRLDALGSSRLRPKTQSITSQSVELLDYTHKDELDLLPHMFFPYTHLSFEELNRQLSTWATDEKAAAFNLYMGERSNRRHKPGRALEVCHYTFELVCDYGIFRDLQRHRMVDALEWQALTPDLGYDVPEAIQKGGLVKPYDKAHRLGTRLYRQLTDAGFTREAQYATLLGNRMRWKLTLNARAAFHFIELRTQPAGHIGYRQLVKLMHDEIAKVHPHMAKAMIFVNRNDDDPSTSRLAQARAAHAKLKALGLEGMIE